jgi:hypothetical protein
MFNPIRVIRSTFRTIETILALVLLSVLLRLEHFIIDLALVFVSIVLWMAFKVDRYQKATALSSL